jgi:hypothetical protein
VKDRVILEETKHLRGLTMRSLLIAASVALLLSTSTALAQYPVATPDTYKMNRPTAQPWALGGYDPRLGYWVHGGLPDAPGEQWAVRAYTPVAADGYWLSHPPGTGFVMSGPSGAGVPYAAPSGRCHPCRR